MKTKATKRTKKNAPTETNTFNLKVSAKQFRVLMDELLSFKIEDVIASITDEKSIRYQCLLAAKDISKLFNDPNRETVIRMLYLHQLLLQIAQGEDPTKTLLQKKGHRRKNDKKKEMIVALLIWSGVKEGLPTKESIQTHSENNNISPKTGSAWYYKHRDEIDEKFEDLTQV